MIKNKQDFLNRFLEENSEYFGPVFLKDPEIGFSIKRNYPKKISFKPATLEDGTADDVATIWIVLKDTDDNKIPITVRISTMSLWRSEHWDYDFKNDQCPTKESVETSKRSNKPEPLDYTQEFFYDKKLDIFVNDKGKKLKGIEILDIVFSEHCDTADLIKGLELRLKKMWHIGFLSILNLIILLLENILTKVLNRKLTEENDSMSYFKGYKDSKLVSTEGIDIKLWGYRASKTTIIIFSCLVVLFCFWKRDTINDGYIGYILNNNFLILVHSILLLAIIDIYAPYFFFNLLNLTIKLRMKLWTIKLQPFSYKRWLPPLSALIAILLDLYLIFIF